MNGDTKMFFDKVRELSGIRGSKVVGDDWRTVSVQDDEGYRTLRVRRTTARFSFGEGVVYAAATGEVFKAWPWIGGELVLVGRWTPLEGALVVGGRHSFVPDDDDAAVLRRAVQEVRGEVGANVQDVAELLSELMHPLPRSERFARAVAGVPSLLWGVGPDAVYRTFMRVRSVHLAVDRIVARVLPGPLRKHLRDVHREGASP